MLMIYINEKGELMIDSVTGILIVVVIIALLFGVKKLPEFARNLGKATGEFQKGKMEAQKDLSDLKKSAEETTKTVEDTTNEIRKG